MGPCPWQPFPYFPKSQIPFLYDDGSKTWRISPQFDPSYRTGAQRGGSIEPLSQPTRLNLRNRKISRNFGKESSPILVVVEGKTYFAKGAKINSTWIEGRPFQYFFDGDKKKDPPKDGNARGKEGEKRIAQFPHSERKALESPPPYSSPGSSCGPAPDEILTGHDLLVQGGKIAALAPDLKPKAPRGAKSSRAEGST